MQVMHVFLSKWCFQYSFLRFVINCSPGLTTTTVKIIHSLFLLDMCMCIKFYSVSETTVVLQREIKTEKAKHY